MERQTGSGALILVIVVGLGPLFACPALLRLRESSALLIHSTSVLSC